MTQEEPKEHIPDTGKMIGDQELKEKILSEITDIDENIVSTYDYNIYEAMDNYAQQYANSKLDELEKWVLDNCFSSRTNINIVSVKQLFEKISSLKQQ